MAGTALAIIYTVYYTDRTTADVYKFFDDSKYIADAFWTKPKDFFKMMFGINNDTEYFTVNYYNKMFNWFRIYESVQYNDNHTIIRFNAFVRLFSFGYFNVHTVFMCFFSFTGMIGLYRALAHFLNEEKQKIFAYLLFLFPSILLWTSGVLKEGLMMFAIGIIIFQFFQLMRGKFNISGILLAGCCVLLMMYLKSYTLTALVPCALAYVWIEKTHHRYMLVKYIFLIVLGAAGLFTMHLVWPDYNIAAVLKEKQDNFYGLAEYSKSGSVINIPRLDGTLGNLILNSPVALVNTLIRPLPGESFSPFIILSSLENIFLLGLLAFAIIKSKKLFAPDWNLLIMIIAYTSIIFVLIGLVTPVLGAMVRYKVPALPFVLFVAVYLSARIPLPGFIARKIHHLE